MRPQFYTSCIWQTRYLRVQNTDGHWKMGLRQTLSMGKPSWYVQRYHGNGVTLTPKLFTCVYWQIYLCEMSPCLEKTARLLTPKMLARTLVIVCLIIVWIYAGVPMMLINQIVVKILQLWIPFQNSLHNCVKRCCIYCSLSIYMKLGSCLVKNPAFINKVMGILAKPSY